MRYLILLILFLNLANFSLSLSIGYCKRQVDNQYDFEDEDLENDIFTLTDNLYNNDDDDRIDFDYSNNQRKKRDVVFSQTIQTNNNTLSNNVTLSTALDTNTTVLQNNTSLNNTNSRIQGNSINATVVLSLNTTLANNTSLNYTSSSFLESRINASIVLSVNTTAANNTTRTTLTSAQDAYQSFQPSREQGENFIKIFIGYLNSLIGF